MPELRVHRRSSLAPGDTTARHQIPVTTPIQTLIDLAPRLDRRGIERMVNEADKYDLVHLPGLRKALELRGGELGVPRLRATLDRRTFRLTKEELERRFLLLAREAGLSVPFTGQWVTASKSTSTGQTWAWSSRPTASATTAPC